MDTSDDISGGGADPPAPPNLPPRLQALRRAIADGTYDTPARLEQAVDQMLNRWAREAGRSEPRLDSSRPPRAK